MFNKFLWLHSVVIISALCNLLYGQDNVRAMRGVVWEDEKYNALPHKLNYGDISTEFLPQNVSLYKYVPKVVTQGPYNMAASWATVWYAGTILEAQRCGLDNISTDPGPALSPFLNYHSVAPEETYCYGPVSMIDVMEAFKENGAPGFREHKDMCASAVAEEIKNKSLENRITGYVKLFNTYDSKDVKLHNVKQALSGFHPVVIAMNTPKSFINAEDFWSPKEVLEESEAGHALCVVAYDDKKYGGAFQVVNSWGKSWGYEGFTWIGYDHFAEYVKYGFELYSERPRPCKGAVIDGFVRFLNGVRRDFETEQVSGNSYRLKGDLLTGTTLQVEVGSDRPSYVYMYYIGPDKSIYYLFPGEANINLFPVTGETAGSMFFPGKTRSVTLEDPPGINTFLFVYSKEEIDGQEIEKQLKAVNFTGPDDLNGLFGDAIVPNEEVKWDPENITFKTTATNAKVVYIVVEVHQKGQ